MPVHSSVRAIIRDCFWPARRDVIVVLRFRGACGTIPGVVDVYAGGSQTARY